MAADFEATLAEYPSLLKVQVGLLTCTLSDGYGRHDVIQNSSLSFNRRDYRTLKLSLRTPGQAPICSIGEASPLPGYGNGSDCVASVDAALNSPCLTQALTDILAGFTKVEAPLKPQGQISFRAIESIVKASRRFRSSSAARFAFETAAFQLLAQFQKKTLSGLLAEYFGLKPRQELDTNTSCVLALSNSPKLSQEQCLRHALAAAQTAHSEGVTAFKVKCGIHWPNEFQLLKELRAHFPELPLRVDFNQGLGKLVERETAQTQGAHKYHRRLEQIEKQLVELSLQWVEDPGVSLTLVPTAIDELLVDHLPSANELRSSQSQFIMIKPMVLGSMETIKSLLQAAVEAELQICLSHFFDGPQALRVYEALHNALPFAVSPPGLSQHQGLAAYLT